MKGINLKKIGAIVAGATILASSVAFAGGLMYQNTELVNENGEPLAKVILGAGSQAVDGVVAAAISNRMANEAYKSATLTAEVVGEATCSGSADACGTCDIVEGSETVTLEITVPGAGMEGVHEFTTAIGDYVDRGLENRWTVTGDSDEGYTVFDDLEDTDANPFQNMLGFEMTFSDFDSTDVQQVAMYDIGAGNFGPFHEATISDTKAGKEYKEKQDVWIHGNNHWDEGDTELYGEVDFVAYTALMDSTGDYGIPVCPGDESSAYDGIGDFICGDLDTLPAHRVYVSFMGDDWVISELENFWDNAGTGPTADQEVFEYDGAIVHLAKEAVSGIINVGEIMEAPSGYKVRLDDISREVGFTNSHPAIITVLDANDNEICQDQVFPGETKDDLCDETTGVKLHVYQTAPGLNFIAKWAEMAIYKDEIELEDGNEFLDDSDTNWNVVIGWTTKGDDPMGYSNPEYLRNIILWTDEEEDEMEAGDVFPVVDLADYEVYDLTYNGIDDENANWDDLKFKVQTPSSTKDWDINDGSCTVWADGAYIEVTTNQEFKVEYPSDDGPGTVRGDKAWYFDVVNSGGLLTTNCGSDTGMMWMVLEDTDGEYFFYDTFTHGPNFGSVLPMKYKHAGSSATVGFYAPWATATTYMEGGVQHPAGKWDDPGSNVGDDIADGLSFFAYCDGLGNCELGAPDYVSDAPATMAGDDEAISYVVMEESADGILDDGATCYLATEGIGPTTPFSVLGYKSAQPAIWQCLAEGPLANSHYDQGFISMRGTKFSSGSDSEYKFKVPGSVQKTTWTFSTVEAADADPDTSTFTLHEGETAAVGTTGVSVHVLSIDQQLTPCTAGTGAGEAPACTPDMSTVSAVVMPNNAPSVQTIVPYSLTSNLVYLDTDNVALDTGVIITVGGDVVNTVTKDAIAGSDVDFEATPVVVKQIGNKIVVAGLNGADTAAAGEQFLAALTN